MIKKQSQIDKLEEIVKDYRDSKEIMILMDFALPLYADPIRMFKVVVFIMSHMHSEANMGRFKVIPVFNILLCRILGMALEYLRLERVEECVRILEWGQFGLVSFVDEHDPLSENLLGLIHELATKGIRRTGLSVELLARLDSLAAAIPKREISIFPDLEIHEEDFKEVLGRVEKMRNLEWVSVEN